MTTTREVDRIVWQGDLYPLLCELSTPEEFEVALEALHSMSFLASSDYHDQLSYPLTLEQLVEFGPESFPMDEVSVRVREKIFATFTPDECSELGFFNMATHKRDHAIRVLRDPRSREIYDRFRRGVTVAPPDGLDDVPTVRANGYEGQLTTTEHRQADVPWVNLDKDADPPPPAPIRDPFVENGMRKFINGVKMTDRELGIHLAAIGVGLLLAFYNPAMIAPVVLGLWGANRLGHSIDLQEDRFPGESKYQSSYMPWRTVLLGPTKERVRARFVKFLVPPYIPIVILLVVTSAVLRPEFFHALIAAVLGLFVAPLITGAIMYTSKNQITITDATRTRIEQLMAREGTLPLDQIATVRHIGIPGEGLNAAVETFGADRVRWGIEGEKLTAYELLVLVLQDVPGAVLFNGLRFPGSENADVDHALLYRDKVVLIDSKAWSPGIYIEHDIWNIWITYPNGKHSSMESRMERATSGVNGAIRGMVSMKHVRVEYLTIVHNKDPRYPQVVIGEHLYSMTDGLKFIGEFLELGTGEDYIDPNIRDVLHNMVK